jgi:2-dehydro-3-deoxyphosphogluconate aldolase/(4S)-4-hydroxy-2-oxoglutarate aldolase
MENILEELGKIGIVPVIKIDDVEKAVPLAKALIAGGIPCAEVTFRTAQGEEAIRRINAEVPGVLLGAGTVLTTDQVDKAIAAGAKFIVSPGLNPKVVAYCVKKGIPIVPGCANPTDIEQALEAGLGVVKFFPAEQAGGLDYIKAVAAPYPQLKFMPTGGINQSNIAKYLSYDRIVACGGSWMVGADLINAGDFDRITALCKEAVQAIFGFSVVHIGINAQNGEEALSAAKLFGALFGFTLKDGNSSVFSSDQIEIMKGSGRGTKGHIGIGTYSPFRAAAWLERQGIAFNRDSIKTDAKGNVVLIYLKEEIAGFAIHLLQKK